MKAYVSVECSRCHNEIKQDETVYCSICIGNKDEALHVQDQKIKVLSSLIKELDREIIELKKEK